MTIPLEISFRDIEPTDEAKDYIRERVDYLGRLYDGITSCQVYISAPQSKQRSGHLYDITVEVRVPGKELVASNRKDDVQEHQYILVALRNAFSIIERDLKIYRQKMRGEVKHHEGMLQGKIVEIRHDNGFGQIAANDGRVIYFHENAVVAGDFAALKVGDTVELVARQDDSAIGPQASTVRPISPLRYRP